MKKSLFVRCGGRELLMRRAVYPGTFDPITNGHIHIAERAARLFDEVIVAVADTTYKENLFSLEERMELVKNSIAHVPNIRVEVFTGLIADYVKEQKVGSLIRGLRAISDFEYEMQLAAMNKNLNENLETIFLMTASEYSFISSSLIKQVAVMGGNVSNLVPSFVEDALNKKYHFERGKKVLV